MEKYDSDWRRLRQRVLLDSDDRISLGILTAVACIANLLWILRDRSFGPFVDNYMYRLLLLNFVDKIDTVTVPQLWTLLGKMSFQGRPPLYQLLTVPFIYMFGRSEDVALIINFLFLIVLIISTYQVGRLTQNSKAGLLAALLVSSYPAIVNLSHWYLPHFALAACVALSLWLLLKLIKTRSIAIAWLFGVSLAFGLLIRHNFMLILTVPTAVFGIYLLLFQTRSRLPVRLAEIPRWLWCRISDRFIVLGLVPGGAIALSALLWYVTWGRSLLEVRRLVSSFGTVAFGFPGVAPSFWWYVETSPAAISHLFVAGAAAGVMFAIAKPRIETSVLVVTLVSSYILLTLFQVLAWFQFSAVLPVVAVLSTVWIFRLRYKRLAQGLFIIYIATAIFNYWLVAWGIPPALRPLALALGYPPENSDTCRTKIVRLSMALCASPPDRESDPVREVLSTIFNDSKSQGRTSLLMPVYMGFVYETRLRPTIFNYYVAAEWPRHWLKAIYPGDAASGKPFNLDGFLKSDYVLYPDGWEAPEPYAIAATRFLEAPPRAFADAHQLLATFELPDGKEVKLIKRVKPLTVGEAEVSIAAFSLPEKQMSSKEVILIGLPAMDAAVEADIRLANMSLAKRCEGIVSSEGVGAAECYDDLVDPSYGPAGALLRLARVYRAEGDVASAEEWLRRTIDSGFFVEEATRELGWMFVELDRGDEAVEAINLGESRLSGVARLRLKLTKARILIRLGGLEQARAMVDRVHESLGERIGWQELVADLYQDLDAIEAAQSDFKLLLGTGDSASPALAELLEELRKSRFRGAVVAGEHELASSLLSGLGSEAMCESAEELRTLAKQLRQRGDLHLSRGLREEWRSAFSAAAMILERVVDCESTGDPEVFLLLGRMLSDIGDQQRAIRQLQRVTLLAPEDARGWTNLCLAYRRAENFELAADACRRALSLASDHYYAMVLLAESQIGLGDWALAVTSGERAIGLAANDQQRRDSEVVTAKAYSGLGDKEAACRILGRLEGQAENNEVSRLFADLECASLNLP